MAPTPPNARKRPGETRGAPRSCSCLRQLSTARVGHRPQREQQPHDALLDEQRILRWAIDVDPLAI